MVKAHFTASPFRRLSLAPSDASDLLDVVNVAMDTSLERYENFWWVEKRKLDPSKWKPIKSRRTMNTYIQQQLDDSCALPSLLGVGTAAGTIDDVMLGAVNPTLESMRLKASYTDSLGSEAVLANVVMPSEKDPFRSVTVKWMELDMPFQSAGLVQNRDYVYVEATGITETVDGERVGFHVLHSVNFPQTHSLPNRVRATMSISAFFRQILSAMATFAV
uniref:START domain-containing protein n=1 Tax=Phytophthora ramorum TaxID=164328 RepID=H3GZQ2_PHYRM